MRHYGFTGTRRGLSEEQTTALKMILDRVQLGSTFHIGDCVGADEEFYNLIQNHNRDYGAGFITIGHPPISREHRAFCAYDYEHPPLPFLRRNHAIVNVSDSLIAIPRGDKEEMRSGTWATVRYALSQGQPVTIVYPDGRVGGRSRSEV